MTGSKIAPTTLPFTMAQLNTNPHKLFENLLKNSEKEGWGMNYKIIRAMNAMANLNVPPEQAVKKIKDACETVTRRSLGPGEVERIANLVYGSYGNHSKVRPYDKPKPGIKVNQTLIDEFSQHGDIDDLRSKSQAIPKDGREILDALYEPDALLHITSNPCLSKDIRRCSDWPIDDLKECQYICPAHFKDADQGRRQDNVSHRRYLVFESDRPGLANDWNKQAGIISRLSKSLPLVLVCWSGNKSLHSWFDCSTRRKDQVQDFITLCVQLGADPACLRPAQLVRMPWGIRKDNGKIQKPIYFHAN